MSRQIEKVVVIGGGNGSATVLSSLKNQKDLRLHAVLSMADDGGSTGRLRAEEGASALGDIRNCLSALADKPDTKKLLSYRFGSGELEGHSFGNLVLAATEKITGDLEKAIDLLRKMLEVKPKLLPSTLDKPNLIVRGPNRIICGVYKIANTKIAAKNAEFELDPSSAIYAPAKQAITRTDLVIIAPGNFYCSIVPALLVEGMAQTLRNTQARVVFIGNLINFANHAQNYALEDYLAEFERIVGPDIIDIVIANSNYAHQDYVPIINPHSVASKYQLVSGDLLSTQRPEFDPNDKIAAVRSDVRHDQKALSKLLMPIIREVKVDK